MVDVVKFDISNKIEYDQAFDFNNDGTVDAADYAEACLIISGEKEGEVKFSQAELDEVFSDLIQSHDYTYNSYQEANNRANVIIKEVKNNEINPKYAKTLNDLQTRGQALVSHIEESSKIAQYLAGEITVMQAQLKEKKAIKEQKEEDYLKKTTDVNRLTEQLHANIQSELKNVDSNVERREAETKRIVSSCVEDYKNGDCPNQRLADVIASRIANIGGWDNTNLEKLCADATSSISRKCSEIESLVSDIRTATQEYNDLNAVVENCINTRSNVLDAANMASVQYQSGYDRRLELRAALVEQYGIEQTKGVDPYSPANAQVSTALADFVQNSEFNNMPFADAVALINGYEYVNDNGDTVKVDGIFKGCGISYDVEKGILVVPIGHDGAAGIYNGFVNSFMANYGKNAKRTDDAYTPGKTPADPQGTGRTDPISFTTKDNVTYDFIQDRDNDGKFDDKNEFLGAQNGWEEMVAYDKNNDGVIMGDELEALQLVSKDNEDGKYNFTNAKDAGVTSITLGSYHEINQEQNNHDILAGKFQVKMGNDIVDGFHTLDTDNNLNTKYATIFGSEIVDQSELYEANPFMEDLKETLNTKSAQNKAQRMASSGIFNAEKQNEAGEKQIDKKVANEIENAINEKKKIDQKNQNLNTTKDNTASVQASVINTDNNKKKLI